MPRTKDDRMRFVGSHPLAGKRLKKQTVHTVGGATRKADADGTAVYKKQIAVLAREVQQLKKQARRDASALADMQRRMDEAMKPSALERNRKLASTFSKNSPDELSEAIAENIRESRRAARAAEAAASN